MSPDDDEPWRSDPASGAQKRKLRFYDCRFSDGLTKGQASDLIDDAMIRHPEREEPYQQWKQIENDLAEWHDEAANSDFCEEGDMRQPTRQMLQETIETLDATRPGWRDEVRRNAFALLLMERYPQLKKPGRI